MRGVKKIANRGGFCGGILIVMVVMVLTPIATAAGNKAHTGAFVSSALPPEMRRQLQLAPERFVREMAELIIGHGRGGAIGPTGIDNFIGLERARVRACHIRRLLQADLDGDGTVTRSELTVLQRAVSARQRGILELAFRRADDDADTTVTLAEIRAMSQRRALDELTQQDAAIYRAVMTFDLDNSGGVTLDEIIFAVARLRVEPGRVSDDPTALSPKEDSAL